MIQKTGEVGCILPFTENVIMLATAFTAMTVSDAERERERLAGQGSHQVPQITSERVQGARSEPQS